MVKRALLVLVKRETGYYISTTASGEAVNAFVPKPLPPDPSLEVSSELEQLCINAERRLGELKVASELVPNVDLFAYSFVRKESVFSSQIEGIQATLSDLLEFEASAGESRKKDDVIDVCNYLDALLYAKKQLKDPKGLPISLRLIKEMHRRLMRKGRGATKSPGEFRKTQNWIGGTRPGNAHFVPPPPDKLHDCLGKLENYLHEQSNLNPLIRIGMAHVQFETIHPFLDGNGRVGRLLIALLLEAWIGLDARLLYLSLYFKKNHQEYYRQLDSVRVDGNWEGWSSFFLEGVVKTAEQARETAQEIFRIFDRDRKKLLAHKNVIIPAVRLFELLPEHPVVTIPTAVKLLKTTKPTAGKAVDLLIQLKILQETSKAKRNRTFGYRSYLSILKGDE